MKTLENINKEYMEHECRISTINNLDELYAWIEVIFDEIDEHMNILKKDYWDNQKCKILGVVRKVFPFIFEDKDILFYDEDNKCLEEAYFINLIYKNYLKQLTYYINDDNVKEIAKFADFLLLYYDKDLNYIYSERDELEYRRKGYGYVNYKDEDNSIVIHEFFDQKLKELYTRKCIEKIKKI